jgi:hypothetical protein
MAVGNERTVRSTTLSHAFQLHFADMLTNRVCKGLVQCAGHTSLEPATSTGKDLLEAEAHTSTTIRGNDIVAAPETSMDYNLQLSGSEETSVLQYHVIPRLRCNI